MSTTLPSNSPALSLKCWCGSTEFGESAHSAYVACKSCGTAVLNEPKVLASKATDSDIKDIYDEHFWEKRQAEVGLPSIEQRARMDLPERCLFWLEKILRYRLPPGRAFEIGCAHGGLVKLLDQVGFQSVGMEMSDSIVKKARGWFGINCIEGPVESVTEDIGTFDVITMFDVVEHLPQPVETLQAVVRFLKPGGLLILQSPEYRSDRDGSWSNFVPPEHIYLFTLQSIASLLANLGLKHVQFEPAMFRGDFFVLASTQPLTQNSDAAIDKALTATPDARIALAMLDLWRENGALKRSTASTAKRLFAKLPAGLQQWIRKTARR